MMNKVNYFIFYERGGQTSNSCLKLIQAIHNKDLLRPHLIRVTLKQVFFVSVKIFCLRHSPFVSCPRFVELLLPFRWNLILYNIGNVKTFLPKKNIENVFVFCFNPWLFNYLLYLQLSDSQPGVHVPLGVCEKLQGVRNISKFIDRY